MWVFLFYRNENPMPKNEECSMEKESIMKDEALEIEALQQEARGLMQEMLLKHQELEGKTVFFLTGKDRGTRGSGLEKEISFLYI